MMYKTVPCSLTTPKRIIVRSIKVRSNSKLRLELGGYGAPFVVALTGIVTTRSSVELLCFLL